jgi:heat shock protein HslJ
MNTDFLARSIVSSLLLIGVATSCQNDKDSTETEKQLIGRDFLLETAVGYEPVVGTVVRLGFTDSVLSFSAGCNHYSGPYEVTNTSLVMNEMSATEMGCDANLMTQDAWLAEFFEKDPTLTLAGDTLTLTTNNATLTFLDRIVADPDRPLTGVTWNVDTLISGDAASSIPTTLEEPSLHFEDDGTLVVETGCNSGTGTFEVHAEELTFSDVTFTQSTCSNSEATALLEQLTDVFIDGTATYDIEAARLTIERGDVGISAVTE